MITIKNFLKIIFSVSICIILNITNNFVYADHSKNITLLGDSITTGFGLSEQELNYGNYLESYFNADINNFAVNGQTTAELLATLNNTDIISSIEESDFVCISIGGNDFLSIFQTAFSEIGNNISINNDEINVSSDFVSKFIMDYSSSFASASVDAGVNIEKIRDKIKNINPDTEIIMQTIYNPLESSNQETNQIMSPLKTFFSLYLATINNSIKEISPSTADIQLKFAEKPYLYTNIDSFDIHPNAVGHMLIAEEIIQTIGETGDFSVFSDYIYNIPQGVFSEFPEYTVNELNLFAEGTLRRGTLEQSVARNTLAEVTKEINKTDTTETITKETTNIIIEDVEEKEENKKVKNLLSKISLIIGMCIIFAVSLKRFWKNKKKY